MLDDRRRGETVFLKGWKGRKYAAVDANTLHLAAHNYLLLLNTSVPFRSSWCSNLICAVFYRCMLSLT